MNNIASGANLKQLLEELSQFGSPVDLSVAETRVPMEKVVIDQVGGVFESCVFELESGRAAYMANIAVTNQRTRSLDIIDVELRTPWNDPFFQWLEPVSVESNDRRKRSCSCLVYRFPNKCGLELGYNEVLNHHLLDRKKLPGNRRLEGWLLAIGGFMPPELRHGQWHDMPLTIIGADHSEYTTKIELWTERLQSRRKSVKPRMRIFVKPDINIGELANRTVADDPKDPIPAGPDLSEVDLPRGMAKCQAGHSSFVPRGS